MKSIDNMIEKLLATIFHTHWSAESTDNPALQTSTGTVKFKALRKFAEDVKAICCDDPEKCSGCGKCLSCYGCDCDDSHNEACECVSCCLSR